MSPRPGPPRVLGWPNVSAPVLAGDLRVIPLPDILLLLNTNHKTGTLRCLAAGATKTIEWLARKQ